MQGFHNGRREVAQPRARESQGWQGCVAYKSRGRVLQVLPMRAFLPALEQLPWHSEAHGLARISDVWASSSSEYESPSCLGAQLLGPKPSTGTDSDLRQCLGIVCIHSFCRSSCRHDHAGQACRDVARPTKFQQVVATVLCTWDRHLFSRSESKTHYFFDLASVSRVEDRGYRDQLLLRWNAAGQDGPTQEGITVP